MDLQKLPSRVAVTGSLLSLALFSSAASALVVDFEGYAAGTIIDDEYAAAEPIGVTFSVDNPSRSFDYGVVFDTNNPTGGDDDLAAPFFRAGGQTPFRPGNVLIVQERGGCSAEACEIPDDEARPGSTITIEFSEAVILESIDFFDIEWREMGTVTLFGVADQPNGQELALLTTDPVLGIFDIPNTGGDNTWDQVLFNVTGVKRVEILFGGSGAIDNIDFAVIPIPPAAWLFASSLGLLGWVRRRIGLQRA